METDIHLSKIIIINSYESDEIKNKLNKLLKKPLNGKIERICFTKNRNLTRLVFETNSYDSVKFRNPIINFSYHNSFLNTMVANEFKCFSYPNFNSFHFSLESRNSHIALFQFLDSIVKYTVLEEKVSMFISDIEKTIQKLESNLRQQNRINQMSSSNYLQYRNTQALTGNSNMYSSGIEAHFGSGIRGIGNTSYIPTTNSSTEKEKSKLADIFKKTKLQSEVKLTLTENKQIQLWKKQ